MLLAQFVSVCFLARGVIKRTDICLIASLTIALDPLILVRMIKAFYCGMTLSAFEATRAVIPTHSIL